MSTTELANYISKSFNRIQYLIKIPEFARSILKYFKPSIFERLFGSLELDNTFTNEKLGFIPPYSSKEGIQIMIEWYFNEKLKL